MNGWLLSIKIIKMKKYNFLMISMHWIIGIMIIANLAAGYIMTDLDPSLKFTVYSWHKSIGIVILGLVVLRIITRLLSVIPDMPKEIKLMDALFAKFGVLSLYVCMMLMPLTGYFMSAYGGYPIMLLEISIPSIVKVNSNSAAFFHQAHVFIGYVFVILIAVHVLYSLKHLFFDKINLFKRMSL